MLWLLAPKLNETNTTPTSTTVHPSYSKPQHFTHNSTQTENNPPRHPSNTMTNCEIVIVATTDEPATDLQIPFNVITTAGTVSAATATTHQLDSLHHTEQQQLLQAADTLQQQVQAGTLAPHLDRTSTNGPEKPFQCNICERRFRQLSTLTNHVKIHTGEKPYKCTICDKTFRQSSTLTNHMKIHTGEKPFTCTFCPKQFRQLSTLTNHLKIHTGEKPFECAVCKKQFRQSSTLNNHIKIHVMDKVYIPVKIKTEEDEG